MCKSHFRLDDFYYGKKANKANVGKKYDATALTITEQEELD